MRYHRLFCAAVDVDYAKFVMMRYLGVLPLVGNLKIVIFARFGY